MPDPLDPQESATTALPEKEKAQQTISIADDHTGAVPSSDNEPKTLDFLAPAQGWNGFGRLAHYRVLRELSRSGVLLAEDTKQHCCFVDGFAITVPGVQNQASVSRFPSENLLETVGIPCIM
jgi:hypothetical protein